MRNKLIENNEDTEYVDEILLDFTLQRIAEYYETIEMIATIKLGAKETLKELSKELNINPAVASQRLRKSKSELSILVKRNQKPIIVYGEKNTDKKKKEYEDIENKDHNIYELEKILIYIYENKETLSNDNSDVKKMSIEELGVHLDEEFKREFEKIDLRHRLNTIGDVFLTWKN